MSPTGTRSQLPDQTRLTGGMATVDRRAHDHQMQTKGGCLLGGRPRFVNSTERARFEYPTAQR